MRRTVGLAIGLCAVSLLTLGGVAGATDIPLLGRPAAAPAAVPVPESATETIGAVEQIGSGLLDYLGDRRRMEFHYPDAEYVKVHFADLRLAPGDTVTVSDPAGTERATYQSGFNDWAMSVTGDTAVVELHRAQPSGVVDLAGLGVTVDRVARGFSKAERESRTRPERLAPGRSGREESICGRDEKADAVCYKSTNPVAYQRSKAVARLLINGTELCTAWRLGAGNRMLTNSHCFNTTAEADRTEVWFNYECATCGGWDVLPSTKVWGDRVLATDAKLDYTLFTVTNFAAIQRFGYLELDTRQPQRGDEVYIPQHPRGEPTAIAIADQTEANGTCAVDNPSYDGYGPNTDVSYYCDTDGGSSGSPVISRASNKVIALHHFGGCPNSGVRVDRIAAQIQNMI